VPDKYWSYLVSLIKELPPMTEWPPFPRPVLHLSYRGADGPYQILWDDLLDISSNPLLPGYEDVTSEIVEEPRGDLQRILDIAIQVLVPVDVGLKASLEAEEALQGSGKSVPFQASDCIQAQLWKDDGKRHRKLSEDEPPFWVNRFSSRRGK
jgi:hypothetical protein